MKIKTLLLSCALLYQGNVAEGQSRQGVPKMMPTSLPTHFLAEEDKDVAEFILGLTVFEDSIESNKFYYMPRFYGAESAATAIINRHAVDEAQTARSIADRLAEVGNYAFDVLLTQSKSLEKALNRPGLKATEIENLRKIIDDIKSEMQNLSDKASQNQGELPKFYVENSLSLLAHSLGSAGFPVTIDQVRDPGERSKLLNRLSKSNGGMLTANIYAGLTPTEIGLFRRYIKVRKELDLPKLSVARLPVSNFEWKSLAETVENTDGVSDVGIPVARRITGAGDFSGATINMDLSVAGAKAFGQVPPPIILPVYATARSLRKYPRFEARLDCDFENG